MNQVAAPADQMRIVLDSPVPYYSQLAGILLRQIEAGVLKPNDQLPSEYELEKTFGVSRTVVRHALDTLAAQGLIYRRKGKGTFVAEPKVTESLFQHLVGFYEEMEAKGAPPTTRVLRLQVEPADKNAAQVLGVAAGHPVITVVRLRAVDGEPIVLSTTRIPEEICPLLVREDLSATSLYRVLEQKFGLKIARGRRAIEALPASRDEARLLKVSPGMPLISVETVTYLEDGRCLEYSVARHRADRTRFEVNLIRRRPSLTPESPAAFLPAAGFMQHAVPAPAGSPAGAGASTSSGNRTGVRR